MATESGSLPADTVQEMERFLDEWMNREDIPGASVAVFDRDGIRYANGLGARTLGPTEPATAETLYSAGSITKTTTAIAILQLAEAGEIDLDDPISDYVDYLADVPGDPITVHELLSHSSGMPTDDVAFRDTVADRDDLRRHVNGAAGRRITGERRCMYYNSGYKVLGELVATVDGRSFPVYVDEEVFSPLGMERSTFDQSVFETDEDAMTGHTRDDDEWVPWDHPPEFEAQPADGGLVAPVTELSRLYGCLLDGGELDGTRILDEESVAAMCDHQITMEATVDGQETGYGYGLMTGTLAGEPLVGHGGATFSAHAYAGGLRDSDLGVAVGFNVAGVPQDEIGQGILAIAAGERPAEAVPGLGVREKMAAVTGTYESYRGAITATVEAGGGHLQITIEEFDEFPAFPETTEPDDYRFYSAQHRGRRAPVEFREFDSGMALLWSRARLDRVEG